jgi:hypothetical protein
VADQDAGSISAANPLTALVASITTVVLVITGLSFSGTMGRILRNEDGLLVLAISFAVVSAICGIGAGALARGAATKVADAKFAYAANVEAAKATTPPGAMPNWDKPTDGARWPRRVFTILALVFALVAIALVLKASVEVAGQSQQPNLTAKISENGRFIEATATATNLDADDTVRVEVHGIERDGRPDKIAMLAGAVGPDAEGNVSLPIQARVLPSRYASLRVTAWREDGDDGVDEKRARTSDDEPCTIRPAATATAPASADTDADALPPVTGGAPVKRPELGQGSACIVIPAPRVTARPEVRLSAESAIKLTVGVKSVNQTGRVLVRVMGRHGTEPHRVLHRGVLQPDGDGSLDVEFSVVVPEGTTRVCAEAYALLAGQSAERTDCRLNEPSEPRLNATSLRGTRQWVSVSPAKAASG